eukprot:2486025-Prymnesium_polylepis.1
MPRAELATLVSRSGSDSSVAKEHFGALGAASEGAGRPQGAVDSSSAAAQAKPRRPTTSEGASRMEGN